MPAYPPQNPVYPPSNPMMPPNQQWNGPPPGQYPPGPAAPMVFLNPACLEDRNTRPLTFQLYTVMLLLSGLMYVCGKRGKVGAGVLI